MPRVSVLIPTWNNEATLGRAIDSILAQTVSDLELLVLDDGSTDSSREIAAAYDDPRIRVLSLPHRGISETLNEGLREARSEVVAVQDADDWSLPERLERELAVLDAEPDVAIVGCLMTEVDSAGNRFRARQPQVAGDVTDILMRFCPIPNTSSAFRRDVALAAGGFSPMLQFAQDYQLWSRIADDHRLVNVPEELAVRELGSSNASIRWERRHIVEQIRVRLAMMRRRRTLRGARFLVRPVFSYLLPMPIKRALRRSRGMAP